MFVMAHLRTLSYILFITKYTWSTIEFEITLKKKLQWMWNYKQWNSSDNDFVPEFKNQINCRWHHLRQSSLAFGLDLTILRSSRSFLLSALETSWRSSLETGFVVPTKQAESSLIVAEEAGLVVESEELDRQEHRRRGQRRGWGCQSRNCKGGRVESF